MRKKLGSIGIVLSGVFMFVGGFAHAFGGWPALSDALREQGVDTDLKAALAIGWVFGSVAMLALGVIVLLGFGALRRGAERARRGPFVAGLAYLLFGVGASVNRFPNAHFLAFVIAGLILCVSLILYPDSGSTRGDDGV